MRVETLEAPKAGSVVTTVELTENESFVVWMHRYPVLFVSVDVDTKV